MYVIELSNTNLHPVFLFYSLQYVLQLLRLNLAEGVVKSITFNKLQNLCIIDKLFTSMSLFLFVNH